MPLPLAHGLVGVSVVAAVCPQPRSNRYYLSLLIGAFLANAADFDYLLVFTLHSGAWHRGFSHSITFAFFVCLIFVLALGKQHIKEAIAYGLAFGSHSILDYVTTKVGGGVELLWPFSTKRLRLGWWGLSEMPSTLPAVEILQALAVEFALFTPLLLMILLLRRLMAKPVTSALVNSKF